MTIAEEKLWWALRDMRKATGFKFRHQQLISPYIVDFVCFRIKLIVELDGQSHNNSQARDQKRTDFLNSRGFKVIRFMKEDVLDNLDGVLEALYSEARSLAAATPPPDPRPQGAGEPLRQLPDKSEK